MLNIEIYDNENFIDENDKLIIKKMLDYIFATEKLNGDLFCELTIVDESKIKEINKQYRNKDYVTDIISFSFWDSNESFKSPLIGEMFLCKQKVIDQAKEYNHSLKRELMFLISHGIYHLLGYDHQNEVDEKEMINKQYNVLEYLKIGRDNE